MSLRTIPVMWCVPHGMYIGVCVQQDAARCPYTARRRVAWAYVMYHSVKCVHYHVIARRITICSLRYTCLLFMNRVVFVGQPN